jgi:uncharacterized RDD family membrane protein YckC
VTTSSGDYTALVPVTGEAVALDLRVAQFPSRTLALALDLAVQLAALVVVTVAIGAIGPSLDDAALAAVSLVSVVAIIVGWPTLIEMLTRGRSLGKIAAGLRAVRDDGGPVRFRHSFVRALFMLVDFWLSTGAIGLISSLVSTRGKRLGDHFAGTVVIRQRVTGAATIATPTMRVPPGLEGWAATLDLTRLPDVTVLQSRQFLSRAASLDPQVRATLGRQLAAETASYLSPPPPPGLPPELYLATVLAARTRRSSGPATYRGPAEAPPRPAPGTPSAPPAGPGSPFTLPR